MTGEEGDASVDATSGKAVEGFPFRQLSAGRKFEPKSGVYIYPGQIPAMLGYPRLKFAA
jgi:hypothetical protein